MIWLIVNSGDRLDLEVPSSPVVDRITKTKDASASASQIANAAP